MQPQFFESAELFLDSQNRHSRSQYLTISAILQLGKLLDSSEFYIDWYECGFLHEKNGVKCYEPRETWGKNYTQITTKIEAKTSNLEALDSIKIDIEEGYTAFCVSIKKISEHAILEKNHHFPRLFRTDKIRHPRDFTPLSAALLHSKNLCLEIGAGKGKHALLFAQQHPERQLIAIERTAEKFLAMQKSADLAKLPNLTPIHADAIAWVTHALPKNSLSQIFILYPNPEPHNPNQRWLNMPFFEFLLSRLQENGIISLASNIENYILEAETLAKTVWRLEVTKSQVPNSSQRTHFEVKYLARGERCWQLDIIKPVGYHTRFD